MRTSAAAVLLAFAVVQAPASAQEFEFDAGPAEICRDAACAGLAADLCMRRNVGGETTVGMGGCLSRELEVWDGRLNAAYGSLRDAYGISDAELAELGSSAPSRADALRDAQRAWIPFRDANCALEAAQWGGGTGGGPATVSCLLSMTAERALALELRLEEENR